MCRENVFIHKLLLEQLAHNKKGENLPVKKKPAFLQTPSANQTSPSHIIALITVFTQVIAFLQEHKY